MNQIGTVEVRELAAWGLDLYAFRPADVLPCGLEELQQRSAYFPQSPLVELKNKEHLAVLHANASRTDLLLEMGDLDWSLGVVDLRRLLAFQRRLSFDPAAPSLSTPQGSDWYGLVDFCFEVPRPVTFKATVHHSKEIVFESTNPNLQIRLSEQSDVPFTVYGGSPFLEAAQYQDRWFLRDGYHRAYKLLRAGIYIVPAVLIHARTIAELGAIQAWFFAEEVLFSDHPPQLVDFLDDLLTCRYTRPQLIKTVRVQVEDSLVPANLEEIV